MNKKKTISIFIGSLCGQKSDTKGKYDVIWNINHNFENGIGKIDETLLTENFINVNPALGEDSKLVFLDEALNKVKARFLNQPYVPRIGKNLPLFWLTGLSQKKPSKTKILLAYEYAQSVKKLLDRSRAMLLGVTIKLYCSDPELEKVLSLLLVDKSENYGFKLAKSKRRLREMVLSYVRSSAKLFVNVVGYFSLLIYYQKNIIKKENVSENKNTNKKILAVVGNDWELQFKDGYVDSIYWPKLSEMADIHGYTMVWLPIVRLKNFEVRQYIERLLVSDIEGVNVSFKECVTHLKQFFLNVIFLIKNKFKSKPFILDEINLTNIVNFEAKNLVLGHSLKMSLYYSLIEGAAKDSSLMIERKPFNEFGRISLYACNDIPVIGMQHGIVNNSQLGYLFTKNELDLIPRTERFDRCQVPNIMGVFGHRMLDRMIANNYPGDWLAVLGDMKFNNAKYNKSISSKLEVDRCMFVLQYDKSFVEKWLPIVAKQHIFLRDQSAHIVIKPHPQNVELGFYAKELLLSSGYNDEFISVCTEPFIDAVGNVDFVVSHSSTAIIESLYKGKPVLLIADNSYENDNSLFRSADCCFPFSNSSEFCDSLKEIRELSVYEWDESRNNFLTYNLENIRSDPYDNFFKLCNSIASEVCH